jgi:antitoxin ParD1/3/4
MLDCRVRAIASPLPFGALETSARSAYTIAMNIIAMNIVLPPEQEQWLKARIADGQFTSPEAAVRQMIAERMAFEADDFAWATPYVDEARAAIARGEVVSLDEAIADIDAHLASLKS